jgi:hypothetical protein
VEKKQKEKENKLKQCCTGAARSLLPLMLCRSLLSWSPCHAPATSKVQPNVLFSHSHTLTLSHSHTLTLSHSHTLTLSHSHTLTLYLLSRQTAPTPIVLSQYTLLPLRFPLLTRHLVALYDGYLYFLSCTFKESERLLSFGGPFLNDHQPKPLVG